MNREPLVSIIVPVYNAQAHIARCIESIRKQTYQNIEIILLNDGSNDVSLPICQMFADVEPRIVLVDKKNSGVSATRNLGLKLAQGEYLQFADSDDYLQPDATRLMVEKAVQYNADMVIAHYNRIDPPSEKAEKLLDKLTNRKNDPGLAPEAPLLPDTVTTYGFLPEGFLTKQQFAEGLMKEPASFYYGVMWNKLYRADIVRQHELQCSEELGWSEDFLFNLSFIEYAQRFYSLAEPVYNYVQNPQSFCQCPWHRLINIFVASFKQCKDLCNRICHTQIKPISMVKTKLELFNYYRELYQQLGLYEDNKLQIYKYLVAGAEGSVPTASELKETLKENLETLKETVQNNE